MRFLITNISEAFKEVNLDDIEGEIRMRGLRAMKDAIELVMNNQGARAKTSGTNF